MSFSWVLRTLWATNSISLETFKVSAEISWFLAVRSSWEDDRGKIRRRGNQKRIVTYIELDLDQLLCKTDNIPSIELMHPSLIDRENLGATVCDY